MCKWACTVLGANVTKETTELRFWTWGNDHVPHFLIVTDLWTHYQCLFFLKINSCVICFQGIGVKKLSWGSTNTRSLIVVVMYKCLFNNTPLLFSSFVCQVTPLQRSSHPFSWGKGDSLRHHWIFTERIQTILLW